jgi:hypothetical protein
MAEWMTRAIGRKEPLRFPTGTPFARSLSTGRPGDRHREERLDDRRKPQSVNQPGSAGIGAFPPISGG